MRDVKGHPRRPGWVAALAAGLLVPLLAGVAGRLLRRPTANAQALGHPPLTPDPHPLSSEAHLPAPSVWPAVLGLGITLLLFGVVTNWAFSVVGALVIARAVGGWIGELCHE